MTKRTLGRAGVKAFEHRGIDTETVVKFGVYTASRDANGEMVPDENGTVVAFPFFEHAVEVGRKYRGKDKKFWQEAGGRRTFWNADVMDDPALEDGRQALIITEGEIDALSAIDCGFPFTVSVPDGAPSVPKDKAPEQLDELNPETEGSGKFEFMYNNRDRLKRIKRFIIATDSDGPGKRLAAELVRRLSPARCSFVQYPDELVEGVDGERRACKDLNDVLMHFGKDRVVETLNAARPYPVRGLYRLSEYPDQPEIETFAVGWDGWGEFFRVFAGEFIVVAGIPNHGKSTWMLSLVNNLADIHRWRIAICSPEMPAVPIIRDRLRRMYLRGKPGEFDIGEIRKADAFIEDRFVFIDTDPTGTGANDEPFDLEWIIDRATDAVLRDGIRVLVIDPWNEVDHARERNESVADYIGRGIRALKRFGKLYGVVVIVVAHPTKEVNKDGKQRVPNLYDIDGAAHWYNKCDHGIIVQRPGGGEPGDCVIHILKVRFEESGKRQRMLMHFDKYTGAFIPTGNEAL